MSKLDGKNERFLKMLEYVRTTLQEENCGSISNTKLAVMAGIEPHVLVFNMEHIVTLDKLEACMEKLNALIENKLNMDYLTKAKGRMVKSKKTMAQAAKHVEEDLPIIDFDDDNDVVEIMDEGEEKEPDNGNKLVRVHGGPENVATEDDLNDYVIAESQGLVSIKSSEVAKTAKKPKSAKDKWADAAIELGITEIDDHFMMWHDTKMGRIHMFKAAEGVLPYRQEIMDIKAVGLGSSKVINYEDDKTQYNVLYSVVFTGGALLDADTARDAEDAIACVLKDLSVIVKGVKLDPSRVIVVANEVKK